MNFALLVENWGSESQESVFSNLHEAIEYATANFSQNQWRIIDTRNNTEHFSYNGIEQSASADIQRFDETQRWREHYAYRSTQRERLARIAANQRTIARESDRERRLRGFSFVGETPIIDARTHVNTQLNFNIVDEIFGTYDEFDRNESTTQKVNWKKYGF